MPRSVETRWSLVDNSTPPRSQTVLTSHDTHGNLTEQVQANGIKEQFEYFPLLGTPANARPTRKGLCATCGRKP
ncbi:hypothetical protein CES87_04325 [Pseudomonas sp. ERMR1:02]|nr:hypothetical protein CES87_04325 [Pseudomonas sp. ERMR1:02]